MGAAAVPEREMQSEALSVSLGSKETFFSSDMSDSSSLSSETPSQSTSSSSSVSETTQSAFDSTYKDTQLLTDLLKAGGRDMAFINNGSRSSEQLIRLSSVLPVYGWKGHIPSIREIITFRQFATDVPTDENTPFLVQFDHPTYGGCSLQVTDMYRRTYPAEDTILATLKASLSPNTDLSVWRDLGPSSILNALPYIPGYDHVWSEEKRLPYSFGPFIAFLKNYNEVVATYAHGGAQQPSFPVREIVIVPAFRYTQQQVNLSGHSAYTGIVHVVALPVDPAARRRAAQLIAWALKTYYTFNQQLSSLILVDVGGNQSTDTLVSATDYDTAGAPYDVGPPIASFLATLPVQDETDFVFFAGQLIKVAQQPDWDKPAQNQYYMMKLAIPDYDPSSHLIALAASKLTKFEADPFLVAQVTNEVLSDVAWCVDLIKTVHYQRHLQFFGVDAYHNRTIQAYDPLGPMFFNTSVRPVAVVPNQRALAGWIPYEYYMSLFNVPSDVPFAPGHDHPSAVTKYMRGNKYSVDHVKQRFEFPKSYVVSLTGSASVQVSVSYGTTPDLELASWQSALQAPNFINMFVISNPQIQGRRLFFFQYSTHLPKAWNKALQFSELDWLVTVNSSNITQIAGLPNRDLWWMLQPPTRSDVDIVDPTVEADLFL